MRTRIRTPVKTPTDSPAVVSKTSEARLMTRIVFNAALLTTAPVAVSVRAQQTNPDRLGPEAVSSTEPRLSAQSTQARHEIPKPSRSPTWRKSDFLESNRQERQSPRTGGCFNALLNPGVVLGAFSQAVDPTQPIVDSRFPRGCRNRETQTRSKCSAGAACGSCSAVPAGNPRRSVFGTAAALPSGQGRYTLHSVGPNQQDDQGDLSSELERVQQQGWGRRLIRGTDVGVRVLTLQSR